MELLEEFFVYFSSFNYRDDIISPYFGQTLKKTTHLKFKNIPICVQDPFEHDFCVTRNFATKQEAIYDWIEHFELTAQIIQDIIQSTILYKGYNWNNSNYNLEMIKISEKGNIARIFELHLPKRCEYTSSNDHHPKKQSKQQTANYLKSKQYKQQNLSISMNWFHRYTLEVMKMQQQYIDSQYEYIYAGSSRMYPPYVMPPSYPPPPVSQPIYPRAIISYPYGYSNFR